MIYLCAGTMQEAQAYCKDRGITMYARNVYTFHFPDPKHRIVFKEGDEVVRIGTFEQREDAKMVRQLIKLGLERSPVRPKFLVAP